MFWHGLFGLSRPKHLDGNVYSCPKYTVTIDPPKNTEKYIKNDEAVWSNIKLFANTPRGQTTETVRGQQFVIRVPPQKYIVHALSSLFQYVKI